MSARKTINYALRICALVVLLCYWSFQTQLKASGNGAHAHLPLRYSLADVDTGKALAAQYCQSCHQLPDPSLVTKVIWVQSILPAMGQYYGITSGPGRHATRDRDRDSAPTKTTASIDPEKWRQINAYYFKNAPETMPVAERAEPIHQLPIFEVQATPQEYYTTRAFTSFVKIDTTAIPHRLIVNNGLTNDMAVLNSRMQTLNNSNSGTTLVNMLFQTNRVYTVNIGYNLAPNDLKNGIVSEISINPKGAFIPKGAPMFDGLNRPVALNIVDMNQDGKPDYLISQFGKAEGKLSWFEKVGAVKKEHVLRAKPGCLKAIVDRSNKLKRPDIWALFAQGDEGIFLYENEGKGVFNEKRILSFPPSYGSLSFDLVDFNGDGYKDIVYVCGDNADYSQILKPYHGVYIYLNDGKNNFTQKYFYPINGCSKAIVKDFDGDGKLDIAAVSEAPSPNTPWEVFVYLKNNGDFNFQAYTLPPGVPFTRCMTMDAGDIDGDGKTDLILGSGSATGDAAGAQKEPLFIVLKNTSGRK